MAKKIKKYKVGLDSETYKISMVSEPAIEVDYVALSKEKEVELKLSSDERHICYGPALIPNKDIYRNNGEQEFYINFTEESIVKMSQEFFKNYKQHEVNLQHEDNADEVFVCESWIVEDPYKDKANALGFNVPKGTWMIAMKVNNIEVWDKVKSGELKGFSVESAVHLEEFNKVENENTMEVNENETFWAKLKKILNEALGKEEENEIEPVSIEDMAEQNPIEAVAEEKPAEEVKVEEPKVEEKPAEEPKIDINALNETIENLKSELEALKEKNHLLESEKEALSNKVDELGKQPSAKPVDTNAKPDGDTFRNWRDKMAEMLR